MLEKKNLISLYKIFRPETAKIILFDINLLQQLN